jgi:hypothetical protein
MFRGEPAITKFDKPFTPYHSSSDRFSTQISSDLHEILLSLHPGHGKLTSLRVYSMRLNALFRLAFASVARLTALNLAAPNNSSDHYAKGTQLHVFVIRR